MERDSPGKNLTMVSSCDASRIPRVVLLIVIFIVSFFGSLFIVAAFVHNVKLRRVQNIFIANICALCIADCVMNMSLVLGALIQNEWTYGDFLCKMNNFSIHLVTTEVLLMMMLLAVHHYLALRLPVRYEVWLTSRRLFAVLIYTWLHGLSFTVPILTDVVQTDFHPGLCLCTIARKSSEGFLYTSLLFCYVAPFIVLLFFQILNLTLARQLNSTVLTQKASQCYSQIINEYISASSNQKVSHYSLFISIIWLILEIPFIVTSYLKFYESPSDSTEEMYPWQLYATFIWMRFSFSSIFPLATFFCNREIWQSVKEWIMCRRNNAVSSIDVSGTSSTIMDLSHKSEKITSPKYLTGNEVIKTSKTFNVPILFATPSGIRVADSSSHSSVDNNMLKASCQTLEIKGKSLDIVYSDFECTNEIFDDTSDYDSSCEVDPFSTSQPVSSRKLSAHFHRTRSMSDPEVSVRLSLSNRKAGEQRSGLSGTSGADSGLDLSPAAGSSSGSVASKLSRSSADKPTKLDYECLKASSNTYQGDTQKIANISFFGVTNTANYLQSFFRTSSSTIYFTNITTIKLPGAWKQNYRTDTKI
ncbi:hypothetical protein Btru_076583 [Bulinus truncatus]|nr:hypothetical protein Btru_076583 [Bulinus truncatus]